MGGKYYFGVKAIGYEGAGWI